MIELDAGRVACAEIHWYEAHGIGKVKLKAISRKEDPMSLRTGYLGLPSCTRHLPPPAQRRQRRVQLGDPSGIRFLRNR